MSFESEVIEAEFRTVSSSKTLKEIESISNAIIKLKRETQDLERQKKEAAVQFGANSKQVKDLTERIRANNAQLALQRSRLEETNRSLKLNEMSTKQLRQRQAELKKALEAVNKEAFPDRWNRLNRALQETTGQLNRTTNGSNAVRKGVGSIMNYAKGLLPAFGFSAIAGGVLSLGKELFELSIQMKSDSIRNTTIFGDSLKYVETQAAQLSKAMGVTNREFVSNAASSADLLKPLGFTSDEAAKLSVKIQELAGPLAEWSKGKYDATQITEVMNGALTGEMERLKGLGIIIQQSSPEYLNLVKAKQKEENCTLDQAKALATLELMYQKSTDAQLAFQAGGNTLLRDWENLKATWRRAKEWMVELFDESATDQLEKQQNLVNALAVELTNTNTSSADRVRILNQLKSISPDIVEGLNAENLEMGKLRENLDRYNGSMLERISLEKINSDVEKRGNKFSEANADMGNMGVELSKQMSKVNPGIAQENISLEEKMAKMKEWRETEVSAFDFKKKNDYILLDKYYEDYQNQRTKVEELKSEYDESLKELETKKDMMLFPSSDTGTTPVSRLLPKGKDIEEAKKRNGGGKNIVTKSLLAEQQDKLDAAQKGRNEATDTPTLVARNKEIATINAEIARLQALGTANKEQAAEKKKQAEELQKLEEEKKKFQEEILTSSLSAIEKEKKSYDEKIKMTGNNAQVLEILEKQHKNNIAKINSETITKYLSDKGKAQSVEMQNMRIRHNEELAGIQSLEQTKSILSGTMSVQELENIKTLGQAKKEIKEKQAKEEREITEKQLKEQLKSLQKILADGEAEGLNLADKILSDEQKQELDSKIRELQEKMSALKASGNQDSEPTETKPERSNVDVLGMTPEDWEALFKNLADGKFSLEDLKDVANALMGVWGMYDQYMTANENRQLKVYEKNSKEKKNTLSQQLDQGIINQEQYNARTAQLDAELEARQSEVQAKQARRKKAMAVSQAIINTAIGITSVYKEPFPLNLILAALLGGMGAAQVATIMAQPDGFKKGGFTSGAPSDNKEVGVVHANEFVATADAVRNPTVLPVLQMIDKAQRDGTVSTLDLSESARQRGFRSGGFTSPVSESTTSGTQSDTTSPDPELKQLLRKNIAAIDRLYAEGVAAHFTYAEHKRMTKSIQTYEQKTTTPR